MDCLRWSSNELRCVRGYNVYPYWEIWEAAVEEVLRCEQARCNARRSCENVAQQLWKKDEIVLYLFTRKVARCCSYSMLASIFSHCCSNARTVPLVWPTFLSLASSRLLYFVVRLSDCSRMYRGGERPSWIRESVLRLEVAIESHRNYNHVQRQQTVEKVRCSKLSL